MTLSSLPASERSRPAARPSSCWTGASSDGSGDQGWTDCATPRSAPSGRSSPATDDVIIAAATAAGKTEAAFLPICSGLLDATRAPTPGVRALYVGPLKALINDQYGRLERPVRALESPSHRWHGDVAGRSKAQVLDAIPTGILLITPESLEALFVLRRRRDLGRSSAACGTSSSTRCTPSSAPSAARSCSRCCTASNSLLRRRVPRIGLSATLGDMAAGRGVPAPGPRRRRHRDHLDRRRATSSDCRCAATRRSRTSAGGARTADDRRATTAVAATAAIADHLYATLRGTDNLVFANSRAATSRSTPTGCDRRCETRTSPNEFFPHHGNLSEGTARRRRGRAEGPHQPGERALHHDAGDGHRHRHGALRRPDRGPAVGRSLRQRLGRSGRRGRSRDTAHATSRRSRSTPAHRLADQLRAELVQSIAMVELLLLGWCEPPDPAACTCRR